MKDMQQFLIEKAQGSCRVTPDEQRLYLETFAERVLIKLTVEQANEPQIQEQFPKIIKQFSQDYQPIWLKISPNVETKAQIRYLKMAQDDNCRGTIVSADCKHSPYGLILHTDHPVTNAEPSMESLLKLASSPTSSCQKAYASFWRQMFRHR